jgi:PAS domain S-box-containing protein
VSLEHIVAEQHLLVTTFFNHQNLKSSLEQKMRTLIFVAAIILMTLSGIISFYYNDERNITSQLVEHTNQVLREAAQTFSTIKDFESGSRGYVITGDSNYLEHYTLAKDNISAHEKKIKELTKDNPVQQTRIDSLSALIDRRITFSQQSIQLRNEKGFEAARELIATRQGSFYMDKIRNLIAEIEKEENNLLVVRQEKNNKSITAFSHASIVFLLSAFVLLMVYFFALRHYLTRCKKAEIALRDSENQIRTIFNSAPDAVIVINDLGTIVKWNPKAKTLFGWTEEEALGQSLNNTIIPHRYRESHEKGLSHFLQTGESSIMGKTIEIVAVNKNKIELNVALSISPTRLKDKHFFIGFIRDITEQKKAEERRVTLLNELRNVNNELETFSYSVSHDLKSPLRTINSFSQILLNKYAGKIDEEAISLVSNINSKSARMNQLIEDLLNFSRLGKKELSIHYVEMDNLIAPLIEEQENSNSHPIEFTYGKLDNCYGDSALLRQVWINLISNAVKYSKTREIQHIQIGSLKKESEIIYWIKDNGIGFDMQYTSKLFEVFQRLHNKSEFEGSGIGLALVRRVIEKHGGRVWAEGKVDVGATFYFSIRSTFFSDQKN